MLRINVGTMNGFAPRLVAEALEGYVEENSPVGTPVTSSRRKGQPLQLKVVDDDNPVIRSLPSESTLSHPLDLF